MYYLSLATVKSAISSLQSVSHVGGRNAGHRDLLAFYLILKLRGLKKNVWVDKNSIYLPEELIEALMLLGGLASPEEHPGKTACMFFTSFNAYKSKPELTYFYNQASTFKSLPSRLKDTIDNSAIDNLGVKNRDDIKFQADVIGKILTNYEKKFNLYSVICWIYRYQTFEVSYTPNDLRLMFQRQFNLDDYDILSLFDTEQKFDITYDCKMMDFLTIRCFLGVDQHVKTGEDRLNYKLSNLNINKYYSELRMLLNENIDNNTLKDVIENYKQVILTGVPGVGKSYFIKELDGFDIDFIQFHQNYSYQDFVVGKTIENGQVKTTEGDLIKAIDKANKLKNVGGKLLLVLDEINRGNISSIFGELMYLLDRNGNKVKISALDDREVFIPENLYILGTMNSSDRSIAVIDYALRRRFPFVKLLPNYKLVNEVVSIEIGDKEFKRLGDFLNILNKNIATYFANSDYQLGHALFLKPQRKTDSNGYVLTPKQLMYIIFYEIVPMLVEYNNGDESVIPEVLSEEIINSNENTIVDSIQQYLM